MHRKNLSEIEFKVTALSLEDDDHQRHEGHFILPNSASWRKCHEVFDEIQDTAKTYAEVIEKLQNLIKTEPNFLEGYAQIGATYLDSDSVEQAFVWYQKGLDIALQSIPPTFKGSIAWHELDNRPFLRLHHGCILCLLRTKQFKKAARVMEQHLLWNPNDNIGVRYLIGDAYLHAGMPQKARKVLTANARQYPPNAYSLGLLEFRENNFDKAATAFRLGFAQNQYIAEMLTGRTILHQHFYWHSSSDGYPDLAKKYLDPDCMALWSETEAAIDFLDWLFNCSSILRERAAMAEVREELTYAHEFDERGKILEREHRLLDGIDDSISSILVRKIKDRDGQLCWPWQIKDGLMI
jgi:tetratricopeptide (TPR) repeat protein